MLALRLTTPEAEGVTTDDGFEIGRVTFGGTLSLALVTTIGVDVASPNSVGGSCPVWVTTAIGGGASPRSAPRSAS